MAKELPYFQFEPAEYLSKDISFCSLSAQGLFMNICSYYWLRKCKITKEQVLRRLNYPKELDELINEGVIDIKKDYLVIKFLDNQMNNATQQSEKNTMNGRKGGAKKGNQNARKQPKNNPDSNQKQDIREDKIKEEEIRQKEIKEKETKLNNTLLSEIKISDLEEDMVEYFEIAKAFQDLFIKNLEEKNSPAENQKKAKFKSYVDPIRLMMTSDGVSRDHLAKVFKFLDSPGGEFWKPNILSTVKLREKFQQLITKSQSQNGHQQNSNQQGGASQAFREKIFKTLTEVQPD